MPWPLRSLIAGVAGTGALSLAYRAEHWLHSRRGPLDYDDSLVPGQIVASILDLHGVSAREEEELGLALRWGYGSSFGLWHGLLRRRVREPAASALFGATLITLTFTMFPALGRTPPPWRWPSGYIATCLTTHAAYVLVVATVDDGLRA